MENKPFQQKKVKNISETESFILLAEFTDGAKKRYDLRRLCGTPMFDLLFQHPAFIKSVRVCSGGCAVCWNDEIDIDSQELWNNGE